MINALEKGDSVKTIGGVFGKITGVKDDRVVVQIAEMLRSKWPRKPFQQR